jgi:hypothetical protein
MSLASPMSVSSPITVASAVSHRATFLPLLRARQFITSLADAITDANERRANREIARFIARNGGFITDDVERQIADRFSRG